MNSFHVNNRRGVLYFSQGRRMGYPAWCVPSMTSPRCLALCCFNSPLNTWRNNNVVVPSKRRHFDVITSKWRRFDVITTLLLRNVFAGSIPDLVWGNRNVNLPYLARVPVKLWNRVWWLCLVPASTTKFASDLGYRMAKKLIGFYKEILLWTMTLNYLT